MFVLLSLVWHFKIDYGAELQVDFHTARQSSNAAVLLCFEGTQANEGLKSIIYIYTPLRWLRTKRQARSEVCL